MKKAVMWSVGIFLFGWLIVNIIVSTKASGIETALSELHDQEMTIESSLSENKLKRQVLQSEIDLVEKEIIRLREERAGIWEQRNAIINKDLEEPPHIEAASTSSPQKTCVKNTAGEDQNQYVRIASEISGNDIDFLALLDAENGLWTPDRVHNDGAGRGFCGISYPWHKAIIEDEKFTDPEWQLRKCYELYKGGTTFYGKSRVSITKKNFTCPSEA